jgi:hypothetical protein
LSTSRSKLRFWYRSSKRFRQLGEERANAIIRKALAGFYRKFGEKWWRAKGGSDLGENMASAFDKFAAGDALDYEVVKQTPDAFEVNVTGCRYAKFFKELGVPELGFLFGMQLGFFHGRGLWRRGAAHPHADDHARRQSLRFSLQFEEVSGRSPDGRE